MIAQDLATRTAMGVSLTLAPGVTLDWSRGMVPTAPAQAQQTSFNTRSQE
jgi:hypothetical protein